MHLRRALLLFAVVLGLAALATAASQPQRKGDRVEAPPAARSEPTARELRSSRPLRLRLSEASEPGTRRLPTGRPAELTVEVKKPGLVEIAELGLSADADPLTPARFDLLVGRPGTYQVELIPVGTRERKRVGVLLVKPPT